MEKWSIDAVREEGVIKRHRLSFKGDLKDILGVIREFGFKCGRPERTDAAGGFNFRITLTGLSEDEMSKLRKMLPQPAPAPAAAREPQAPEPAPVPAQESLAAPPAQVGPAPPSRPFWGLDLASDPKCTLDNTLVGPYNRFSCAAAASVVEAPGQMYNPLFLFGGPGVGKTHMLRAIANGLETALGGPTLLTSGTRLVNAVTRSLAEGKVPKLEKHAAGLKALLVDDLHLLNLTDANKAVVAKIFAAFFGKKKQVVLTSLYPARALGEVEEGLGISFAKGWSVNMKLAGGEARNDIVLRAFSGMGVDLTNEEAGKFIDRLDKNYPDFPRWVRRLTLLRERLQVPAGAGAFDKLLEDLFPAAPAETAEALPLPQEVEEARRFTPPAPQPSAKKLAMVLPLGQENLAPWVTARLYDAARDYSLDVSFQQVHLGSYDANKPLGAPFQIGDMCRGAGADVALVVGTPESSELSGRQGEFCHVVGHVLGDLDISMGWLPHAGIRGAADYLRVHLDFTAKPE